EQAHFGMNPPALWAALTIGIELVGPLLILTGRLVWLGAGMLGIFTLLAAFTANAFWTMPAGQDRFMATNAFFEHLGLIGGFILIALVAGRARRDA
ncbi:MAG: DoxX family protein, partial [Sphingobium limneticum]